MLVLARLMRDVIDLCYPGLCAACREGCEAGGFLCDACESALVQLERHPACDGCGGPMAMEGAPCPFCRGKGVRHFRRVHRLGTFDEPLKGLIHRMKYNRQWAVAEQLAERLLLQDRVRESLDRADVLVPVPLHFVRQVVRGFNQAEVIARLISRRAGKRVVRAISRVRYTQTQTELSREERAANVRNAFRLDNPAAICAKHVIVIDDVMTTGATLQTVARTLREGRPASLTALVLAVADPKGRNFRAI